MPSNQKLLLKIVKTWNLKLGPEYRGFRCANCQNYMAKAWHHWLFTGGYKTPVHFCNDCENNFRTLKIKIKNPEIKVVKDNFKNNIPQSIRKRLEKIAVGWDIKVGPVYKNFTCDNCQRKTSKAWHVWFYIGKTLAEAHLCKKCGNKFGMSAIIKGIIYDFDGTLVDIAEIHKAGWIYAGKKFNIKITGKMLEEQSGISDEAAAEMMLPRDKQYLTHRFIAAKVNYLLGNLKKATIFPGVVTTINDFLKKGYMVWVCTSAHKDRLKKVLNNFPALKNKIKNNIVWREMYKRGKPNPEALNLTLKKAGLSKFQVVYIGDAFGDYKTSQRAGVKFVYFCPKKTQKDKRILRPAFLISSHKKLLQLLN